MLPKTITSKKFPAFIRDHKVAKQLSQPIKAFADIGLEDCCEKITIDNERYWNDFNQSMSLYKKYVRTTLTCLNRTKTEYTASQYPTYYKVIEEGLALLRKRNISKTYPYMFFEGDDKISLIDALDVINELSGNCFPGIVHTFKLHWSLLSGQYNICFSSHPWDIVTMSMRGISSCQRWEHEFARRLLGSVVDPYTALIYLSNNEKTKYGSKMIKRAVVRLVADKTTGKPSLFIERIYPFDKDSKVNDYYTFAIFRDFIAAKTKNKFPIIFGIKGKFKNLMVPKTEPLTFISKKEYSYRDSKIKYAPLKIQEMDPENKKFWLSLKVK